MPATLDDIVKVNPMIVAKTIDRGAVLMNSANGDFFELNAVGSVVWDRIGRGESLPTLVDAIAGNYGVDREKVSADVLRLIEDLAGRGIVILAAR
jgi:hypothetical protein